MTDRHPPAEATTTPPPEASGDAALTERLTRWGHADPSPAQPPHFDAADVAYAVDDTPIGRLLYAVTPAGALVAALFAPDAAAEDRALTRIAGAVSPRIVRIPARLDAVRREYDDFLHGRRRDWDLPLDYSLAGPFQSAVLAALQARVGYGERSSYGALAAALGRPTASRAVGAALGSNPLCVVLPCHRVVSATGSLTGYAGGLAAKQYLLELESSAARLL